LTSIPLREGEVVERYPDLKGDEYHIDILTALLKPDRSNVVAGSNLFGDILTDLGPAGTVGIARSDNINPDRALPSMFEPIQRSALDIAGQASPIRSARSGRGR
jgi:tartrate dehydrogenase/decarboxylase / D-malate dehydrogenase